MQRCMLFSYNMVSANLERVCIGGCESRNSPCNSSDSEKKDGDNMDADNIAMAADLQEVTASQSELFDASFV